MQTFLPYADFAASVATLDMKRLGKQRVETYQVVMGLLRVKPDGTPNEAKRNWGDHVVGRMWVGRLDALWRYQLATCNEWTSRGYKDTCLEKTRMILIHHATADDMGVDLNPEWLGTPEVHASHRSNLLRKDREHYGRFGWDEPDDLPYVWPST